MALPKKQLEPLATRFGLKMEGPDPAFAPADQVKSESEQN